MNADNRSNKKAFDDHIQHKAASSVSEAKEEFSEERKADSDQNLRERNERLRSILDAAVDAMIVTNLQGDIVETNSAVKTVFGFTRKELSGQNFTRVLLPLFQDDYKRFLASYREDNKNPPTGVHQEITGRRKDGTTFPMDLAWSEIPQRGLLVGTAREITVRTRTREALRVEHEFNERLLETSPIIILVLDSDGRIVRYNRVLEKISGRPLKETQDCDWFDTFLPEPDRERIRTLFRATIDSPSTSGTVNPIVTQAGDEREIEWYPAALREANGRVVGLLCSGIDVTDRLRLEGLVYQASEEEKIRIAQDLHDGLCSLLSGIAFHGASLSERLRNGNEIHVKDTDQIVKNLQKAITQTRTLAHGLNGIDDRPDALQVALKNLAEQVRSTSRMNCRFQPPGHVFEMVATVAANHVFRIAQESVSNALRHSGGTHITISLKKEDNFQWGLKITDNGRGFDPAKIPGDGIGLNTMKFRARAIGAKFSVQMRQSSGTRVECHFPSGRALK